MTRWSGRYTWGHAPDEGEDIRGRDWLDVAIVVAMLVAILLGASVVPPLPPP